MKTERLLISWFFGFASLAVLAPMADLFGVPPTPVAVAVVCGIAALIGVVSYFKGPRL